MERRQKTAWFDWIGTVSGAWVISVNITFVQGTYRSNYLRILEDICYMYKKCNVWLKLDD